MAEQSAVLHSQAALPVFATVLRGYAGFAKVLAKSLWVAILLWSAVCYAALVAVHGLLGPSLQSRPSFDFYWITFLVGSDVVHSAVVSCAGAFIWMTACRLLLLGEPPIRGLFHLGKADLRAAALWSTLYVMIELPLLIIQQVLQAGALARFGLTTIRLSNGDTILLQLALFAAFLGSFLALSLFLFTIPSIALGASRAPLRASLQMGKGRRLRLFAIVCLSAIPFFVVGAGEPVLLRSILGADFRQTITLTHVVGAIDTTITMLAAAVTACVAIAAHQFLAPPIDRVARVFD